MTTHIRNARQTNRYEARTFINDETCGYTIFDHVLGRVVDRGEGYDGNYASQRAADRAIDTLRKADGFGGCYQPPCVGDTGGDW